MYLLGSILGCSLVDPWVKSSQGQSTWGWLKIPLVDIQNPGPQNSGKWEREDLLDLVLFCMCFLMSWTSFYKHDRAKKIYEIINLEIVFSWNIFHTSGNAFGSMWFLAWIVTYIQLGVSCLWNDVKNIRKHMQKALNLLSPLSHFPKFLRTRVLNTYWGYLKSP